MMPHQNLRGMNRKSKSKHRKVSIPKTVMQRAVRKPHRNSFKNGQNVYVSMKPQIIAWSIIKYALLYGMPVFLLHGIMFSINAFSKHILPNEYETPIAGIQLLILAYLFFGFLAYRKISDHLAYYRVEMLVHKYDLNQQTLDLMLRGRNKTPEMLVMDQYRNKFNKYLLFPSAKELAIPDQLYRREEHLVEIERPTPFNGFEKAQLRSDNLSLENRLEEHHAAKEIADWNQERFGGPNAYDEMVKKYKHRTVPAIREIIAEVQNAH